MPALAAVPRGHDRRPAFVRLDHSAYGVRPDKGHVAGEHEHRVPAGLRDTFLDRGEHPAGGVGVLDRAYARVEERVHVALELGARVLSHDDDPLGRAALCTASAAAAMASSSRRVPTIAFAAAATSTGRDATAVIATRASRTVAPSRRTAAARPTMGKSNELRSRSLR